ncbi:SOS response-associated peptidase [Paenibacillus koleovorans]|uniref:SOS response-associated peptidase n=1 Tax=Paenibacillus koleovorans TaxID=121608 RepID=UPI000FDA1B9B|nr:SOS response-associated peptidase [Paenibacillus koleovorans]
MCGRYTITLTLEELVIRFVMDRTSLPFYSPRYNVAPGQMIMAVIHDGENNRAGELKWGLIPSWTKPENERSGGTGIINARSESVAQKPSFKALLERKRCIIPADSFYEWKPLPDGKGKQPMRIQLHDGSLFAMAALYDTWLTPEGQKLSTATIITTEANELIMDIHSRMPVILRPEDEKAWLDRNERSPHKLLPLLRPYPAAQMKAYPVSQAVGNVRNDTPELLEEVPVHT